MLTRIACVTLCVLASLGAPVACRADTIVLNNGQTFNGTIVSDSGDTVEFSTSVNGIPATLKFKRAEIKSTQKSNLTAATAPKEGAAPAPTAPSKEKQAKPAPPAPPASPTPAKAAEPSSTATVRFLVVPVKGRLGTDAPVDGIESALKTAAKMRVPHVVFEIDSASGDDAAGPAVVKAIAANRADIKCHALVHKALGPALWLVAACDTVYVKPQDVPEDVFADTASSTDTAGAADRKARAAALADVAAAHAHNADLFAALIDPARTLVSWTDERGAVHAASKAPAGVKDAATDDGPDAALSLNARDAVRLGLAAELDAGPDAIGATLGISRWKSAGGYGEAAMRKTVKGIQEKKDAAKRELDRKDELQLELKKAEATLQAVVEAARAKDPSQFSYGVYKYSNMFTPESAVSWKHHTDDALDAWRRVIDLVDKYESMEAEAKSLGFSRVNSVESLKIIKVTAESEMSRLRKDWAKMRL